MQRSKRTTLKAIHVTEKAAVLQGLVDAESNPCVKRCQSQKVVFRVDSKANKVEIRRAVEEFFSEQKITVKKVNTITLPRKKKRMRGAKKMGYTAQIKKAVVTLKEGDRLDLEA